MRTIYLIAVVLFLTVACNKKNKEKDPDPTDNGGNTNVPKGTLIFHLHNYIDVTEVDAYNIVYTTTSGRKILLSKSQFYLSGFELVKLDGSVYTVPDTYILKTQENQVYTIGQVPVGNYKTIRFKVGLNSTTNASIPTTASSDILNKPDMWFGSSAQPEGYVFLHVAGKIDTTTAANSLEADMVPFEYRIGTNAQYKQVVMPDKNFSIITDQVEYAHLYVDMAKIFEGVVLNDDANLTLMNPSDNATSLGTTLGANISNLFYYEE